MKGLLSELKQFMESNTLGDEEIQRWVKSSKKVDSVVRMPGDASTRQYFRVHSKDTSYIVMKMESFQEAGLHLPFLSVQRHLFDSGVDVPGVLDVESQAGLILLEDLGDVTLLRKLQEVDTSDVERHLYQKVIDSLVQLQVFASKKAKEDLEAFRLRFDHEKLMWEVNFTVENFYQIYLKRKITSKDLETIKSGMSEICSRLANEAVVLTHRDFHSRNVMVTGSNEGQSSSDRFVMIDFQDARMGPRQYDLVSLLKDSYYQLDEAQILFLVDYYIARSEAIGEIKIDRAEFFRLFDLMSVQRNFKAIGSFASFLNRRGDATYLKYIGNTFENIRRSLLKYPEYSKLREILFQYYYF